MRVIPKNNNKGLPECWVWNCIDGATIEEGAEKYKERFGVAPSVCYLVGSYCYFVTPAQTNEPQTDEP